MEQKIFILWSFVCFIFMILGGLSDAWMWRKPEDTDGKGHDFPKQLRDLMHIPWLGGFSMKFPIIGSFGWWMCSAGIGFIDTLIVLCLIPIAMSTFWDMTYSKLKDGTWTRSLEYWWFTKETVFLGIHVPEIKIGCKRRSSVIISYILRLCLIPIAYGFIIGG